MKKSIDFAFAEVESLKADMKVIKSSNERYDQQTAELQLRFNGLDRYGISASLKITQRILKQTMKIGQLSRN